MKRKVKNNKEINKDMNELEKKIYTLSSGVQITFEKVNMDTNNMAKSLMVNTFKTLKLDKNGQIKENGDQIGTANAIIEMQDALLASFVSMVRTIDEELEANPNLDKKWFKKLKKSPSLIPNIDLDDEDDLQFCFLKFVGFVTTEDWALLTSETVGASK